MNLSEAIIALTTIAVDQRREIQALKEVLREVGTHMKEFAPIAAGVSAGLAEQSKRLDALEAASTITLPPDLVAAIGQAQQPTEGEGGTVTPPAIL